MTDWLEKMAPNLKEAPYGESAVRFIEAAESLGGEPIHNLLRVMSVYSVYHGKEIIEKSDSDPIPLLCDLFERNTALIREGAGALPDLNFSVSKKKFEDVEQATGEHYGNLFAEFDEHYYFEEPVKLLRDRFERNGLPIDKFQGQRALDAGCGGGVIR